MAQHNFAEIQQNHSNGLNEIRSNNYTYVLVSIAILNQSYLHICICFCSNSISNNFNIVYKAYIIKYWSPFFALSLFFTLSLFLRLRALYRLSCFIMILLHASRHGHDTRFCRHSVVQSCIHMKTLMKKGHNKPNTLV